MDSTFSLADGQLYCKNSKQPPQNQAIIGNVADFQLAYRLATASGVQILSAKEVEQNALWGSVSAVEICLDLQGNESNNPEGTYKNCQGADTSRNGRLHLVFRNVFDLRTQKGA